MAKREMARSARYEEDRRSGSHTEIFGSWYNKDSHEWGFGCCRSTNRKRKHCRGLLPSPSGSPSPSEEGEDEEAEAAEEEQQEVRVSERLAKLLEENPNFSGRVPMPEEEEGWRRRRSLSPLGA